VTAALTRPKLNTERSARYVKKMVFCIIIWCSYTGYKRGQKEEAVRTKVIVVETVVWR
jgi:hypothetical protein